MLRAKSGSGRISVIVSTYNWPEALRTVLYSLSNQTDNNFEVIVDGRSAQGVVRLEDREDGAGLHQEGKPKKLAADAGPKLLR
jgi:hypothetical protein